MFFRKNKSAQRQILETLYEKHKHFLFLIANNILFDAASAEDAVHDTIMKVSSHLDKINPEDESSTRNYLAVICKNTAIDAYNKRKNILPIEDIEIHVPDASHIVCPEDSLLDKESYYTLVKEIESLPVKYRDVLIMHRVKNHSTEEIAELFNISIDAAYKRLQRGKAELSKRLEERECKND